MKDRLIRQQPKSNRHSPAGASRFHGCACDDRGRLIQGYGRHRRWGVYHFGSILSRKELGPGPCSPRPPTWTVPPHPDYPGHSGQDVGFNMIELLVLLSLLQQSCLQVSTLPSSTPTTSSLLLPTDTTNNNRPRLLRLSIPDSLILNGPTLRDQEATATITTNTTTENKHHARLLFAPAAFDISQPAAAASWILTSLFFPASTRT